LSVEHLECRIAPATVNWINAAGGDWDTASNWDSGATPGASDDVVINPAGISITHAGASKDSVRSLTAQADLNFSAGTLSIANASTLNGALILSGSTLSSAANLTVNGSFTWSSGTLNGTGTTTAQGGLALGIGLKLLDGQTLNVPGSLTWTGG